MVKTIEWTEAGVVMIDQTRLPREEVYVTCRGYREVAEAIRTMVIRGAPAIGVAAAMGLALSWIRARTGSLAPPYFMHLAYNSTLFVLLYLATEGFRQFG